MTSDLAGRVALVTGASSGIGNAIALALAAHGVHVCGVGRDLARLTHSLQVARTAGLASTFQADLSDEREIQDLARDLIRRHPSLDVLVHSAGVFAMGTIEHATVSCFDDQYRVNVRAPYFLTQALLPTLARNSGQVIFINSSVGLASRGGVSQYAATKHALRAIADSLREEANQAGIRVSSIYVGRTASPMQEAIHAMELRPYRPGQLVQPADVASVVVNALMLPRTAEITDINIRPMLKP